MTEKRKKLIISCISGVLILALLCGTIFLIGSKPSKSNGGSSLEAYSSSEKEKWQFSTIDLTGKLTKEEKGQIKDECQSLLDSYNSVMFNLTPDTGDYSESLLSLCVSSDVQGSNREENAKQYSVFRNMGVESSYTKFEPLCITVNDNTDVPTVVINGLLSINYKSGNIAQGDYDVCAKYTLVKRDDRWLIYNSQFTTIYQSGTVKTYSADAGNTINYTGTRIGSFE